MRAYGVWNGTLSRRRFFAGSSLGARISCMKQHRMFELKEYDPAWRARFLSIADEITPFFGSNLISLEHIGSTSIPGMVAKPQIDVLAVVRTFEDMNYEPFTEHGYVHCGRGYVAPDDDYLSKDGENGDRIASIHVLEEGNSKIDEYRDFRDYLTENTVDRDLYISTKRDLYASYQSDYAEYDSGKKEVIDGIKARAKIWSEEKS